MRNRECGNLLLLFLALTSSVLAADGQPLDLKGVRVLVCAGYFDLMNIPAVRRLQTAGAEVRKGDLGALTVDVARQYHLVIALAQSPPATPAGATSVAALEQFVKAGGGLLFFRHYYYSEKADQYLTPFGASMPWELIRDPAHTYTHPAGFRLSYAYTDRVKPNHPVTEGVKGIWYSAGNTFLFHTSPIKASDGWTVLVTGADSASSHWVGGLHEEHLTKAGMYSSAPPFIAAREYGAGAIVLIGISPMEVFYGQALPAYKDIAMEKGDGLRASDTKRLYDNALRWLAGRALASRELGQGDLMPVENEWGKPHIVDWSKDVFGGDLCTNPARGVIGAHSSLSDGKASPEAFIAKAKEIGLQWIAFTERLESFSHPKWEQLRKICKESSSATFAALPGLDYEDNAGARYVVFGDFDWPPETVFSEDKKRIIQPQWWFNINTPPNGPYDVGHSPLRPWDFSLYNFWPIRTTIAGKKVDESVEPYRYLHGIQDDPFPMAVEMCYDESQVVAAARRMCNFITQDAPGDLCAFYRNGVYYGSYRGFVSEGPVVTDWRAINDSQVTGGKWWLPGTEQYRVKLSVRSDSAITDIRIYDGPYLFRRFCPNQQRVSVTFDAPHDQQRNLVAEITDADGRRAITGGLFIRSWLNWRFMCSDRGNSICDAIQVDDAGAYLTGPTAPYQRKMTAFGVCAGYGERHFNILPPDFDGGMRPVGMQVQPIFSIKDYAYTPAGATLESKMEVPLCSRDGIMQDNTIVGYFPGSTDAWRPKLAPRDIENVQVRYRYLNITPRAHDPGVLLLEGSLRFEHPMTLESLSPFYVFHTSELGEGDHYALVTPETTVVGMAAPEPFSARGKMAPGSYVCLFPSLWGSTGALALDDGYIANVHSKAPNNHIGVSLANMPRQMKAGEELKYRLILMHGRAQELPNTAEWDQFAVKMGLRGKPAYEVKDIKAGNITGTRFLLEVEPFDGGFSGTITQSDLPVRLPVRVTGMNPNWTFAWFDLDRKEWYPSAIDRVTGSGFFTLDTRRGPHRVFAGHPVLADHPDVRIAILSDGKSEVRAHVNNVNDKPVTVTVRLHPALGDAAPQRIELASGELRQTVFEIR